MYDLYENRLKFLALILTSFVDFIAYAPCIICVFSEYQIVRNYFTYGRFTHSIILQIKQTQYEKISCGYAFSDAQKNFEQRKGKQLTISVHLAIEVLLFIIFSINGNT